MESPLNLFHKSDSSQSVETLNGSPSFDYGRPGVQFPSMPIRVGVCCMAVKRKCKPMQKLLSLLRKQQDFEIVEFEENVILNRPVTEWPVVQGLICFHSNGFPLEKSIQYCQLHPKIWSVNDVVFQRALLDRRYFYEAMRKNNIPMVEFAIMNRENYNGKPVPDFMEHDNFVEIDGKRITKPFVEKPVNANDHDICVYFPDGAGAVKLFRKVDNKSSEFYGDFNDVRTDGSYIYEAYLEVDDKQDVKVYTVGMDYFYAELRKSPVIDGTVERDDEGFEVRRETQLMQEEIEMCQKVVQIFKQRVCGMDILRHKGKSYICDVNGWSFVKKNEEYSLKQAEIISTLLREAMLRRGLQQDNDPHRVLRGVFCVTRHGDRTPKQKCKMSIDERILFKIIDKDNLQNISIKSTSRTGDYNKLLQLKAILEQSVADGITVEESDKRKINIICGVISEKFEGLKIQVKVQTKLSSSPTGLLICKWGGWLTQLGIQQARAMGENFTTSIGANRTSYFKQLFKDTVRITTNNERRVMKTGLEFGRAFCQRPFTEDMLDISKILEPSGRAEPVAERIKQRIAEILHSPDWNSPPLQAHRHAPGLCHLRDHPLAVMNRAKNLIEKLITHIPKHAPLHGGETAQMMKQRWNKLLNDFAKRDGLFDTTKIPDIFDYIIYDSMYNQTALHQYDMFPLFRIAEWIATWVTHAEYGIDNHEKLLIGALNALPLLERMKDDATDMISGSATRCRMYFCSESIIHSFLNLLFYSGEAEDFCPLHTEVPLHYLTQLVLKVYQECDSVSPPMTPVTTDSQDQFNSSLKMKEQPQETYSSIMKSEISPGSVHFDVHLSPGIDVNPFSVQNDLTPAATGVSPLVLIKKKLRLYQIENMIQVAKRNIDRYNEGWQKKS